MSATSRQTLVSHSPVETEAIGESWGNTAAPGLIIGLSGDLGAGKTQLVKGMARALGFRGKVQSPTFALINQYDGRIPLFHLDLYRLDTRKEIIAAGLEEYFYRPNGIAVIEWIERWVGSDTPQSVLGTRFRLVKIEQLGETERRITYEDSGA